MTPPRGAVILPPLVLPGSTGVSSTTRVQIVKGLAEGDAVALPTELTLRDGEAVTPAYQ